MIYELDGIKVTLEGDGPVVAASADVIGNVLLKANSSVWFGAVIRGDTASITVGQRSNIQDGAVVHADDGFPTLIGNDVTIGHKAVVHGCTVGDNSLIGIGAVVLNGAEIGKNCIVGAGALVKEGMVVPDNSLVVGNPAVIKKTLGEAVEKMLAASAEHYAANGKRFSEGLKVQQ